MVLSGETSLEPLQRDEVLASIYESCKHRPDAIKVCGPLCDTSIDSALRSSKTPGLIEHKHLLATVHEVLQRFDAYAANHYEAYFMKRA